jgi:hypothetical protein
MVISNIIYNQRSAQPTTSAFVGLYDISGNILALSSTFSTNDAGYKKISFSPSYTVPTTGLYFTTLLFNNATTPTVLGVVGSGVNIGTQTPYSGTAPIYLRSFFVNVTNTTLPSSLPLGNLAIASDFIWMAVS